MSVFLVFSWSTYEFHKTFFKLGNDFSGSLKQVQNMLVGFGCTKSNIVVDICFNGNRNNIIGGDGWFPEICTIFRVRNNW